MRDGAAQGLLERLGMMIESRAARAGFVVLIILSLLPYRDLEQLLRPLSLLAFGAELCVRVPLLARRNRTRRAGAGDVAFLLVDILAFVSFLPLEPWLRWGVSWLALMRLSRLLVLLRFARDLAADLYSILTRREQLQQFGLVTVAVAALAFVSAVLLRQLAPLGAEHDYDGLPGPPEGFRDRM